MIQPIIHEQITYILMRNFGRTPTQAAELATKLITTFQAAGLDIIRGEWVMAEPPPPTWEEILQAAERKAQQWTKEVSEPMNWETLASRADELEQNGRKPWNPPELQ